MKAGAARLRLYAFIEIIYKHEMQATAKLAGRLSRPLKKLN